MSKFDLKPPKDNIAQDCIQEIRRAIVDNGINASGRTQRSFNFTDTGDKLRIFMDKGGAPPKTLQTGRAGGKVPKGFVGIIAQWIKDKGLKVKLVPYKTDRKHKYTVEERSLNMMSGAIANKIKEVGTGRHLEPRDDIYTPALEKAKARFIERWRKELREVVTNIMIE
mgnify:CR=1 FL=1